MNPILSIAKRELRASFTSVTAYIVIALFLLIAGGLFWLEIFNAASTELSMRTFFTRAPFFLAFFAPAISMGLLAEEQRSKTLELLMTLPVTDTQVVVGKFLAALTLLAIVLGATLPYPLSLATLGDLDWGPIIGGYVGLLFLGAAYLTGVEGGGDLGRQVPELRVDLVLFLNLLRREPAGLQLDFFLHLSTVFRQQVQDDLLL